MQYALICMRDVDDTMEYTCVSEYDSLLLYEAAVHLEKVEARRAQRGSSRTGRVAIVQSYPVRGGGRDRLAKPCCYFEVHHISYWQGTK